MPRNNEREYRSLAPLTATSTGVKKFDTEYYVEGFATTFDQPYLLFEIDGLAYYEIIDRHALDDADMSDVIMQYDHCGKVFARQSNNTLLLEPQERGLFIAADLSKTDGAKDLHGDITAGMVTKMSWAFIIEEEVFDHETRTWTILKIKKVYDVSAVSIPANDNTEISARSYARRSAEAKQVEQLQHRAKLIALKTQL